MATKTLATMKANGEYRVIYDDSRRFNPYRIYYIWSELGPYGVDRHRELQEEYGDFYSAMIYLASVAGMRNREKEMM